MNAEMVVTNCSPIFGGISVTGLWYWDNFN